MYEHMRAIGKEATTKAASGKAAVYPRVQLADHAKGETDHEGGRRVRVPQDALVVEGDGV